MSLFKRRSVDEFADNLALYLPNNILFKGKNVSGTNLRKLIVGLAGEIYRANSLIKQFSDEFLPDQTERFIPEWESALGIPDGVFTGTGTTEERRRDILIKLASLGVQTNQDFVDLAAQFGVTVTITPGIDAIKFPLTFPIPLFATEKEARNSIVVNYTAEDIQVFPLTFPVTFGTNEIAIIQGLFNRLKPVTTKVIYRQI